MLARRRVKIGRWLSMLEVADLMQLGPASAHVRAQKVRRLITRMGERDGREYLKRIGRRYYVSTAALEQLLPWEPGTLHKLQGDVDELRTELAHQKKRLNDHAARFQKQQRINGHILSALKLNAAE